MKDQHTKIKGYRDLSQEEIDLMNEAKELAERVGQFIDKLQSISPMNVSDTNMIPDGRWLNIAKTDLQQGFMSLTRAVAKPTTF